MGSFWIWIIVAILFGFLCSVLFIWLDDYKSSDSGNTLTRQQRFVGSMAIFTAIGLILAWILSLIFAD